MHACMNAANPAHSPPLPFLSADQHSPPSLCIHQKLIGEIAEFIRQWHPDQSGIVYCLTSKDAEAVAAGLKVHGLKAEAYLATVEGKQVRLCSYLDCIPHAAVLQSMAAWRLESA